MLHCIARMMSFPATLFHQGSSLTSKSRCVGTTTATIRHPECCFGFGRYGSGAGRTKLKLSSLQVTAMNFRV